ncbi:Ribonuclease H2, subunit C [Ascosphaera apis ARSEF 7405]|uniref:Ribonuclease H2, subunit C n=1 Tax=Ascosphaera apis ARSEF 7405 TaxID=392613 RepID=A0A168C640_9EURO|nr:Ribonuclease H2, subunit C [Ascosphaera apis ARSEF 7405]
MFTIQRKTGEDKKVLPNILPCRIHHDGPVDISERYWSPEVNAGEVCESVHFRGRRLKGRKVVLPEGYEGLVVTKTDKVLKSDNHKSHYEEDEDEQLKEQEAEPTIITADGTFSEFMIWGHEAVPEDRGPYIKGIEEWIAFSQKIHVDCENDKPESLEIKN